MKHEKSCGAVILKEKQVLVVQQVSGFYNYTKGHIEKGETEEETAIREVKEETNLDIKITKSMRFPISNDIRIDEKN